MQEFSRGFVAPFKAFGFIFKHRLAAWYLVPIGIWIVLIFGTTFSLASWLSPYVEQWLSDALGSAKLPEESFWTAAKSWLQTGIQFASAWVLRVLIWIALGRVMKYVILILMSPLLAWISEVTEEKLTGKEYPFDLMQLLSDAWRGVLITLRNLFLELLLTAAAGIVAFMFPPAAALTVPFLFLVNSYFMGFSMFDYYTERQRLNISESVAYMRRNRWCVTGLGVGFNLISLIPILDWVVAPINGAVGAVLCVHEAAENKDNMA